ncbi:hypothetical protein TAMYLO_100069 [Tenacibaculum amylolyticum]
MVLPTYLSLIETGCEYSLVINDIEDDSEKTNDLDIKIIHFYEEILPYKHIECQNKIAYLLSEYNSLSQKLESPPPELYSYTLNNSIITI